MACHINYYPGGYDDAAPAHNQAEEWNDDTRTYTCWDEAGNVTTSRPYTDAENAAADAYAQQEAAPVPITADPATVAALISQTQNATTVAQVKQALLDVLNALAGETNGTGQ